MTRSKRLTLEWDYYAEPLWEGGINLPLGELKDPEVRKDIRNWYKKFSRAEEVVDEVGSRPHSRAEVKEALIELKHLIPEGKKLAARVDSTLRVDYGHDPGLKELEFEIFGEGISEIEAWWKSELRVLKKFERHARKKQVAQPLSSGRQQGIGAIQKRLLQGPMSTPPSSAGAPRRTWLSRRKGLLGPGAGKSDMDEDLTCDYSVGQPRCGRSGFREVWRNRADGAWYVLCYKHFVQEKKLGHLAFWGSLQSSDD